MFELEVGLPLSLENQAFSGSSTEFTLVSELGGYGYPRPEDMIFRITTSFCKAPQHSTDMLSNNITA